LSSDKEERLREIEDYASDLTSKRSELFNNLNKWRDERGRLNQSVRTYREEAGKHKSERDKINTQVSKLKVTLEPLYDELDRYKGKVKEAEGKVKHEYRGLPSREKVQGELNRIEWRMMTTPTREMVDQERRLIERAEELRKILEEYKEIDSRIDRNVGLEKNLESTEFKIKEIRENMNLLAAKSQEHHENMIMFFQKADEDRVGANKAHINFVESIKAVKEINKELDEIMNEVRQLRDELDIADQRNRSHRRANERAKLEELRQEVLRKLEDGKKLSYEELQVLYGNEG
jgi:uncharacterized coiled-coil DUF342 family protein